jgi:hypothetical protein
MGADAFGPIRQVAYLVDDIDASVGRWSRFAGVGPWTIYRGVAMVGRYRDEPTDIVIDVALSYQDELQLELIRPRSRTVSPYQDSAGRTLIGMHHIAWMTDDLERDKNRGRERGMAVVFEASNPASKVAYLASPEEPGLLFELMQASPMLEEGFAAGVAASQAWDGREPVLQVFDFGG